MEKWKWKSFFVKIYLFYKQMKDENYFLFYIAKKLTILTKIKLNFCFY